ncbi:MAG: hybrid sensor histidine kinase/response regulator [Thermaurantimonas sp.]|uniref:ATP-binding response regulator n=1 Tax=Thermaurantimonas sp. TaxID=2681568 RepID=UPI00391A671E
MNTELFKQIVDKSQIPTLICLKNERIYENQSFNNLLKTAKINTDEFIKKYLQSDKPTIEISLNDKNIYFHIYKQAINTSLISYQIIDVTEEQIHLKNLENSLKSLHEIDKQRKVFLENLSHELRTPLTGIIGFTDLLKYTDLSEEAQMYLESLSESANRMVETLNNINDFTLLTSENNSVEIQEIDIYHTLKSLCDASYYKAKAKQLKIHLTGEVAPEIKFFTDIKKLETIVKQLLSNAIKFTDKGKIEISYEVTEDLCRISVKDTGIGIPEDKIDECFDDFKQLSEGYNRHYEGSGIGLSIVRKLVNLLKGNIRVESRVNEGSTFTIEIPNAKVKFEKPEISITKKQGNNILYVEDNYLNQKLLQISLGKKYNITLADNAEEGLKWIRQKDFDLVLMDINLGKGMDGIQAMKEIKKYPKYSKTPVIALTAYALANDEEKFLKEGFDDYIPKPYTKDEITSKISKFIHA